MASVNQDMEDEDRNEGDNAPNLLDSPPDTTLPSRSSRQQLPRADTPASQQQVDEPTPQDEALAQIIRKLPEALDEASQTIQRLAKEKKELELEVLITGGGMFVAGLIFGVAVSFVGHELLMKRFR